MTTTTVPPVTAIRDRFPSLTNTVHLAACSIAARSIDMDHALATMLDDLSRPGFWTTHDQQLHEARQGFADLIGATAEQVAVLPNTCVAAYQAVAGLRWRLRPDVVCTTAEFPGIAHVWLAQQPRGASVRWCDTQAGQVTTRSYLRAITTRTALVSVPAVTYRDGIRPDIPRIADAAHAAGAQVIVDAYQAAGVMPIDVNALRCDYLAAGTGKYLLGLPGLAFLYVRHPQSPLPTLTGWFGRIDPHAHDASILDFPPHARRLETGTPSVAAVYTAVAALSIINKLDQGMVRQHTQRLVVDAATRLAGQGETVRLANAPGNQGAHLALVDPQAERMSAWLAHRGIIVAPRDGVVRLAMHAYTTDEDIDVLCEAVDAYRAGYPAHLPTGATR
ncbi:aminotransferase class V-fold PLP-dependent enzyme [Micromonospora haikouensis]|uniref:aminotransferase class V-fold PLP-dependent enzyme n=1 Tax=Micromonospora haikouensis TaxID=686309 RepID=UPI00378CF1E7